jgi:hypothetical protein
VTDLRTHSARRWTWKGVYDLDEAIRRLKAFECDVLRSAFVKSVVVERIPEDQWRATAALLIQRLYHSDDVDSDLLDWIVCGATMKLHTASHQNCRATEPAAAGERGFSAASFLA